LLSAAADSARSFDQNLPVLKPEPGGAVSGAVSVGVSDLACVLGMLLVSGRGTDVLFGSGVAAVGAALNRAGILRSAPGLSY